MKKQKLGFWSIVLFGVNSMIGTGIFLTPGVVIKQAGTLTPWAYVLSGLFALILGVTFAQASRYTKENGAAYAYVKEAFGEHVGLYIGITRAIAAGVAWGVMITAATKTFYEIFFPTFIQNTQLQHVYYFIGMVVLLFILLVINFNGTRLVAIFNNVSTLGKISVLLLFIISGGIILFNSGVNHFQQANNPLIFQPVPMALFGFITVSKGRVAGLVVAIVSALYTFTGFEAIANAAEDMENPNKNLPRAIPTALVIVTSICVTVIVVGMLLGPEKIVHSPNTVKLAAVFTSPLLKSIIVFGAFVSMFGINVATSFGVPRIFVALANQKVLPSALAEESSNGVPTKAFLLTAFIAMIFPVALGFDVASLAGLSVIVRFLQYILVPLALIKMSQSKLEKFADISRNKVTDVVVPLIGFFVSIFLVVMYDYKIILYHQADMTKGFNYFSIFAVLLLFFVIPGFTYWYYFKNSNQH